MDLWQLLPALSLLLFQVMLDLADGVDWDYIIVGAGPAGLQMGFHLQKAGRRYIILERANVSGGVTSIFNNQINHRFLFV